MVRKIEFLPLTRLFRETVGCIAPDALRFAAAMRLNKIARSLDFKGAMMGKRNVALCALVCLGLAGCQGKPVAETRIPPEEIDRKNPVESNAASIAAGKQLYGDTDCALCHGKEGEGKGVLAKDVSMNVHDWRRPASLDKFTDGELSYLIANGKGKMPKYAGRETPEQIWQMVNYIRSIPVSGAHQ
jgi:mono/diheme cytochrome c family protein